MGMIISHGSVTSYMRRILNSKSPHIKIDGIEEFKMFIFHSFLNMWLIKRLLKKHCEIIFKQKILMFWCFPRIELNSTDKIRFFWNLFL